ncbi:MAG: hypothetical protein IJ561_01005 [Ruminococcus sp.]|nr:hypothetical protein [Ruminococcus sp.]
MAQKICPSCGSYYKGSSCDKCGYGKPETESKELEKYKKKIPKKPVRFMTQEEIKTAGDNRKKEQARRVDPNARRNLLIAILIVTLLVLGYVLISRGLLFSNRREDVINQYWQAFNDNDFDKFIDTMPGEIRAVYKDERSQLGLGKEEYMRTFKKDLEEIYGAGFTITVEQGREDKLDKSEIDLTAYKQSYGSAPTVTEAYAVACTVTYSGSKATETFEYDCYVGKVGWKWRIFNAELNEGIVKSSNTELS